LGQSIVIPRSDIAQCDVNFPFIKKKQSLIVPPYAMTNKRSGGQSFDYVSILWKKTVFAHGQLHVALSRCKNLRNFKIYIKDTAQQGDFNNGGRILAPNIVYAEILKYCVLNFR
jgi:hypothetical protein